MGKCLIPRGGIGKAARVVAVLMVCGLANLAMAAQAGQDLAGTWQGTLEGSKSQRIVVRIAKAGAGWAGVVYNLDADMAFEGRNTTQMSLEGGVVRFAIAPVDVSYEGRLSADGLSIGGAWKQGSGDPHPLTLARAEGDAAWEIPKPDAMMANDADPDWDVATVKPSDPNDTNAGFQLHGRRIYIERMTVESMLKMSYGVQNKQIESAPDWVSTERWDVQGEADMPGKPSLKQYQGLVRKLLAERFGLKTHTETREMAVCAITVAKGGPKMSASAGDPNGLMSENDRENGGQRMIRMSNSTMADFALLMKFFLDRPVVDQTGLSGRYDFQLQYTFDESRAPTDGTASPSLFTAIQEQMGLKLDPVKAPMDVMVIDKVERPSAN